MSGRNRFMVTGNKSPDPLKRPNPPVCDFDEAVALVTKNLLRECGTEWPAQRIGTVSVYSPDIWWNDWKLIFSIPERLELTSIRMTIVDKPRWDQERVEIPRARIAELSRKTAELRKVIAKLESQVR
jgi:hypothetical protein